MDKIIFERQVKKVRVDNAYSYSAKVKSGIPQGSVLGHILFIIFINDMPDIIESTCQMFADDAKVFCKVNTNDDSMRLQDDLTRLSEWSKLWKLPFNIGKCKSLHIGRSNNRTIYKMDNQELQQVREEKDLGVLIDEELKFHKQTAAAVKKANSILGLIRKSFVDFDKVSMGLLYKSLFRPHLEYCNVSWGLFNKGDIIAVEKIQRRATKLVPESKHLSYQDRLQALDIPSLSYRRQRGDMIATYKLLTNQLKIKGEQLFSMGNVTTRGHKYKLFKQHATKFVRTFSNRIVTDWNSLPEYVVEAPSTDVFQKRLGDHWKERKYITTFR